MGDRCIIQVKGAACAAYTHWGGSGAIGSIREAIPTMRKDDPDYSAARLLASLCNAEPDNTGIGEVSRVTDPPWPIRSPGDAGIVVYDCRTGFATCHHGYLAEEHPDPLDLGIPPA